MNSEVIQLQSSIIKELENLPFISNLDNIFTMSATEHNTVHNNTTTSSGSTTNTTTSGSMGKDEGKGLDFKTSLLTLVADLVDSACHAIRNDLIASSNTTNSSTTSSGGVSSSTGNSGGNSDATDTSTSPESLLDRHLGWMRITLADGSTYSKAQLDAVARALAAQDNTTAASNTATSSSTAAATASAETDSTPSTTNPNSTSNSSSIPAGGSSPSATEVTQRLALLPDYRAKTLYLASLVDLTAVRDIIGPQLLQRLEEVMLEGRECISRAHIQATTSTTTSVAPEPIVLTPHDPSIEEYKDTDTDTIRSPPTSPTTATTTIPVKDINLNDIDEDFADIDCDIAAIDEEIAVFDADIRVTEQNLPLPPLHSTVFPPTPPTTTTLPCSRSSDSSSSCSSGSSKSTTSTTNSLENENLAPNLPNFSQPTQA